MRYNYLDASLSRMRLVTKLREKRGLLNAIGSISKSLFGTLDEDDLTTINQNIDKLFDLNNNLTSIISNQTHVMRILLDNSNAKTINMIQTELHKITKETKLEAELIRIETY